MDKNYWKVSRTKEQTAADYKKLAKAIEEKNFKFMFETCANQSILRCFVIRRGENDKYLKIIFVIKYLVVL